MSVLLANCSTLYEHSPQPILRSIVLAWLVVPLPSSISRAHVLQAIASLDRRDKFDPFGEPTKWRVVHHGKPYPPKAVLGLAARHATGVQYLPRDFSSGFSSGQACKVLEDLGFTVEAIDSANQSGKGWSDREVELVVTDYFDMLRSDLLQDQYDKAAHRRKLKNRLESRSDGSVEFKHQNISAVLVGMGLPYIGGYKPRSNYQHSLIDGIEDYLSRHPDYFARLMDAPSLSPGEIDLPKAITTDEMLVEVPDAVLPPPTVNKPWLTRTARRYDFRRQDARNAVLGKGGERLVVEFERRRLTDAGRDDLAGRVEWSSQELGDGLGYDVRSFDAEDESERLIEVKTTGLGRFFPFYLTRNELRCSEDVPDRFRLYRVFDYARAPRIYVLEGSMAEACDLQPTEYLAAPSSPDES